MFSLPPNGKSTFLFKYQSFRQHAPQQDNIFDTNKHLLKKFNRERAINIFFKDQKTKKVRGGLTVLVTPIHPILDHSYKFFEAEIRAT